MGEGSGVLIMGASLGTGNRGVSALGASLVRLVDERRPGAPVAMLIGQRSAEPFRLSVNGRVREIPVVNWRNSPKAPWRQQIWWIFLAALLYRVLPLGFVRRRIAATFPWIQAVVDAELVGDIRGGDSFSDIYGLKLMLFDVMPMVAVTLLRGGLVLFPQTYGPYKSAASRVIARWIIRRARWVMSRDREGVEVIQGLVGTGQEVLRSPDVAFCLDVIPPAEVVVEPALTRREGEVWVGVNVNGLMYNGGYNRSNMFGLKMDYAAAVPAIVTELLRDPKVRVVLVPHTFAPPASVESDPEACRKVAEALPVELRSRVHRVAREYDQHEIKWIIGRCDFFIGSRMHSCIAALSQGIPTLGIAYSRKFLGVFDSIGVGGWVIDCRTEGEGEAVAAVRAHFAKREEMRKELGPKVSAAQASVRAAFSRLFPTAGREGAGR